MKVFASPCSAFVAIVVFGLLGTACSAPEPTPTPAPTPTPTPTPIPTPIPSEGDVYIGSLGSELELFTSASEGLDEVSADFFDSVQSGFLGMTADESAASAALAALDEFERRADALRVKLTSVTPPPECERVHALLTDMSELGLTITGAMRDYINAIISLGIVDTDAQNQLEVSGGQVFALRLDIDIAGSECR